MNELTIALQIAVQAHNGQKDKVGVDYIRHPIKVAEYCKTPDGKIAGLLHDTIEDTDVTAEYLRKMHINDDAICAVENLTKTKDESIDEYHQRVASSDISIEVKFADMRHNSEITRFPKEQQHIAIKNLKKYAERMEKLLDLTGKEKAKKLMTPETYEYIISCVDGLKKQKTQPSKLSTEQKANIITKHYDKYYKKSYWNTPEESQKDFDLHCLVQIYNHKADVENYKKTGIFQERVSSERIKIARKRKAVIMQFRSETKVCETNPLVKLIEAEERING